MVFHRAILVASAIFFAAAMSPAAFAGCGGCGFEAGPPAAYAPEVYAQPAYAQPLAIPALVPLPVPVAPAPIAVDHWDTGGCGGFGGCFSGCGLFGGPSCGGGCGLGGCGGLGFGGCNCGRSIGYTPSPLYVVDQGPDYSGPGLMVPYGTYAPGAAYAPAINYPYIGQRYGYRGPGYRYGVYRGARFAYRANVYAHSRYYRARPYSYR